MCIQIIYMTYKHFFKNFDSVNRFDISFLVLQKQKLNIKKGQK